MINPKRRISRLLGLILMLLLTCLCILASLSFGSKPLPLSAVWQHYCYNSQINYYDLVINARESRTFIGLMAGAALALAGAVAQGLLRNPLGDPGLLGINAGAATAVVFCSFVPSLTNVSHFWAAFIGASLSTLLFYFISGSSRNTNPVRLILTGVAINACLLALVQGVILINPQAMDNYRFWSMGALNSMSLTEAGWLIPYLLVAVSLTFSLSAALNIMVFGDGIVHSLGGNVALTRLLALLSVSMLAAVATAMAGPIAFIGLAAPHLMRTWIGSDFRWLLPYSMFAGSCLLLISDVIARLVIAPEELMVGIITAAIGAPLLYWVAKKPTASRMIE